MNNLFNKHSYSDLTKFVLYLADNNFIMSHRLTQWCGHGPYLEEDISLTNIALDLLGQSRLFYEYAAELNNIQEDDLVYTRSEREYRNLLLCELPNEDYAQTILKLYLYTIFYIDLLDLLVYSSDKQIQAIAQKAKTEVINHLDHSEQWVTIFSHSTQESRQRLQKALDYLQYYIFEPYQMSDFETKLLNLQISVDLTHQENAIIKRLKTVLQNSEIKIPDFQNIHSQLGGKNGEHTEHFGYILAEVQHLNMKYSHLKW